MFTGSDVVALRQKTGAGILDCKKALTETDGDMDKAVDYLREKGIATAAKKASRIAAEGVVAAKIAGNVGAMVEVNCETDFVAKGDQYKEFVAGVVDYVLENDVKDAEALIAAKADDTVAATAKIGEKIAIRRFEKYVAENGVVESYIHMGGKVGVLVEIETANATDEVKAFAHDVALQIAAAKPLYVNKEDVPADVLEHEKEILRVQALNEGKPEKIIERMVEGRIVKYYEDFCLLFQKFVKDPEKTIAQVEKEVSSKAGGVKIKRFARFEMGEGLEKKSNDFAAEVEAQMKK
ncbi:MAG: elongation factor Ts [Bacillota bacterium]|nr:MAG: elongation factor Ts [Bacillota bacterium]